MHQHHFYRARTPLSLRVRSYPCLASCRLSASLATRIYPHHLIVSRLFLPFLETLSFASKQASVAMFKILGKTIRSISEMQVINAT